MEEINIKDFFIYLKKYIIAFVVLTVLAVGGVVVYNLMFKTPIYQAQTTVVVAKTDAANEGGTAAYTDVNMSQKLVSTYGEIAKSELVLNQVINNLGLRTDAKALSRDLTIQPIEDTSILSIKVKNPDARRAAAIANEIAKVFSTEVLSLYSIENVKQLSVASVPESPANKSLTRDVVLAALVAIFAVVGFAFLRFYLDDTIKHGDDAEKTIGLPTTGLILKGDAGRRRNDDGELIVEKSPKAIVSENIKSLRTNLQFTSVDKEIKTILITSTNASEGKSFVSSNLATSFAQADKKVLLVDCDLRKGRLHRLFRLPNTRGLSNLLTSDLKDFDSYIQPTRIKNLDVITCGTYPPNPSELLASKKNKQVIEKLKRRYDIVIFDGAPVGGLADSVILSSYMDETLIVVKDGNTSKADLMSVKESLEKVGANIAGIVFNMVDRKATKYYNSYYYYGYSSKE